MRETAVGVKDGTKDKTTVEQRELTSWCVAVVVAGVRVQTASAIALRMWQRFGDIGEDHATSERRNVES